MKAERQAALYNACETRGNTHPLAAPIPLWLVRQRRRGVKAQRDMQYSEASRL